MLGVVRSQSDFHLAPQRVTTQGPSRDTQEGAPGTMGALWTGQDRTGQDRGQDRTERGQDGPHVGQGSLWAEHRIGQDGTEQRTYRHDMKM